MKKSGNEAYKFTWWVMRTLVFLFIGLKYTLYIEAEEVGTLEHYLGFVMLAIALIDSTIIIRNYISSSKKSKKEES